MAISLNREGNSDGTIDYSKNIATVKFFNKYWNPAIRELGITIFKENGHFNKSQLNDVISLKSIDPTSPTYRGNGATNRVLEYLDKLDLPITVDGKLANKVLDVRIPQGKMNNFNMSQQLDEVNQRGTTGYDIDAAIEISAGFYEHGGIRLIKYYYNDEGELIVKSQAAEVKTYELGEDGQLLWSETKKCQ